MLKIKILENLEVTCDEHVYSASFLDRDCPYKPVAMQIPHDTRLAPIPYDSRKVLPHCWSNQRNILQYEFKAEHYNPWPEGQDVQGSVNK